MHWTFWVSALIPLAVAAPFNHTIQISVKDATDSQAVNVYLDYPRTTLKDHVFVYSDCNTLNLTDAHHTIAHIPGGDFGGDHTRLVWVVPEDAKNHGCIFAWEQNSVMIGQSQPLTFGEILKTTLFKRDRIMMSNESGIDAEGPWFNGVDTIKIKEIGAVDVKAAKSKSIGIIGGGISGMMTYYLLHSVGFKNLEISESTDRVGGRIWTEYFEEPESKYQYQEMGAMRIPITATFPLGNESLTLNFTSHQIVFQLAEALNKINGYDKSLNIDWIPFLQNSDNALSLIGNKRNTDGSIPTVGDVAKNSSLGASALHTPNLDSLTAKLNALMYNPEDMKLIASNIYEAHKKFLNVGLNGGGDEWSQTGYVHNALGYDLNTTDLAGELVTLAAPFWVSLYDNLFFSSKEWKTIDKGMSRLPNAFKPLIGKDLKYNRKIQEVHYLEEDKKVQVSWKNHYADRHFQTATYDYTFVAVPFTVVRKWKLPEFSHTLSNAISRLGYQSACKMALQFKSRFWEHLERPIFGSCNTVTDIPGMGNICYPGYNVNSSGPAVMLTSYNNDDYGERWVSTPEKEHAQHVLDGIFQLHGEIAYEQYTGNFKRVCWLEEESNAGGSWALPTVGQHQLYIPSYFKTENNFPRLWNRLFVEQFNFC
ncbi:hypothetical protein N7471_009124 [Penicillium samsonianum]|uniref:uncharacterized protein n=1 Tax=Penicillium samsonianum TaxID=1882272 RepID=UPI002548623B|nr:uncharacterized protein N7471_009124 [Penicillium samsonianum]KAJ6127907.1 hypothetical protein N7471_009124 [Penicillium samsonianum]